MQAWSDEQVKTVFKSVSITRLNTQVAYRYALQIKITAEISLKQKEILL